MPQSLARLYVHLIFSTKNRQPLITEDLQPRLFEYMGGILRNQDAALLAAGGIEDHVHLLVSQSRKASLAETLRDLKANSSGWIHKTVSELSAFAWQSGYGAFSVSHSQIPGVRKYLAKQREHHKRKSFKEEFIEFLERHEMKYDERYVWD